MALELKTPNMNDPYYRAEVNEGYGWRLLDSGTDKSKVEGSAARQRRIYPESRWPNMKFRIIELTVGENYDRIIAGLTPKK